MLDNNWLSTCAPIGVLNRENSSWNVLGAGIFIFDNPCIWYVTAHHLIIDKEMDSLQVLVKHKKDKQCLVDIQALHKQNKIDWITHLDNDLAATVFPFDPNFIIKAVDINACLNLKDIIPSMRCYSVGCRFSFAGFDVNNLDIGVLDGIISSFDIKDNRIYVTVPIFPGNIGGPLFVAKQQVTFLGGIISEYVVVSGTSNTENEKLNLPPLHLGKVIPAESIINLIKSSEATKIKEKIKILPGSAR